MQWWIWILGGVALLFAEIISPGGFYLLFFGVGALVVGALRGAGLLEEVWQGLLVFTIVSVLALLLFRNKLVSKFAATGNTKDVDSLKGEIGKAMEEITPNGIGKVELRGTAWTARNIGEHTLAAGARCLVQSVDGLQLSVRSES